MTGRFILADLTSHKRGFGVQSAVNAAARQAQTSNPPANITWIIPNHLAAVFPKAAGLLVSDRSDEELWSEIRQQIDATKGGSGNAEITIVTWSQFIYDRAHNSGLGVIVAKWFVWLDENRAGRLKIPNFPATYGTKQDSTEIPSAEEIEKIVVDYLRSLGSLSEGMALYRSKLRPELGKHIRLGNVVSSPLFGFHLKTVVDSAVRRGVLGQSCISPGQERLWVVVEISISDSSCYPITGG